MNVTCSSYVVERLAGVVAVDRVFWRFHQKQLHWCREIEENLGSGVDNGTDDWQSINTCVTVPT